MPVKYLFELSKISMVAKRRCAIVIVVQLDYMSAIQ